MKFRKDVNGLRAIAVIAVVLFHFNASWMPGGFAGVDVFFVISGFLMTGIIFRGFEQQKFSILKFYVARANRIIPALAALCMVLLVFGWFYLTPLDYETLGKNAASSMTFISNIMYWRESGYFASVSRENWLLHTWSLSVEWQFYIIYPLVLVAMRKFMSIKAMKATVLAGVVSSFILCVIVTSIKPNPAYYLLPTRAWEMMVGGVAYLYPFALQEKRKKLFEWSGLFLILVSCFLITKDHPWPGYLAIFPVLGTFLILQAQRNDSFITTNLVSQKIGAWSYSIYLWHWPLVVAIYYFSLSDAYVYAGILLSLLLGFLSNKYIENIKLRNDFSDWLDYLKCKPVLLSAFICLAGSMVFITSGFEYHYPNAVVIADKESNNINPHKCLFINKFSCFIGNDENIKAIIVGDSHADALATAISHSLNLSQDGMIALTKSSCPFVLNIISIKRGDFCYKENIRRMEYLSTHYFGVPVFLVSRIGSYLYGETDLQRINNIKDTQPSIYFTKKYSKVTASFYAEFEHNLNLTVSELLVNHPVYLVQPTPEMRRNIPKTLSRNIFKGMYSDDLSIDYNLYLQRNENVRRLISRTAAKNGIQVLDPAPYLCFDGRCIAQVKGRPIYYDGDHMSEYGNKLLAPMFQSALEKH
ncbi:MAG: peptidoglycan/LPS O-acetylase OafA/YrhL [Oleispira sp.]|jgi:peptidoglycan/LPS O-acetylase OafA/YrhL